MKNKYPVKRGHRSRFLNASIHLKLKFFRRGRGRKSSTLYELEKKLNINRTTLNRWEKNPVHQVSACYAIGVLLSKLYDYKGERSQAGKNKICQDLIKILNEYHSVKDLLTRTNQLENDSAYHMLLKYKASLKQKTKASP